MKRVGMALGWVLGVGAALGCSGKLSRSHESSPEVASPEPSDDDDQAGAVGGRAPSSGGAPPSGEGGAGSFAVDGESSAGVPGEAAELPYCAGVPTTEVFIEGNLDALEAAIDSESTPWDRNNPGITSNCSFSFPVYDALGRAHYINFFFRKSDMAAQSWSYYVLEGGLELSRGTVQFDEEGGFVEQLISQIWSLPLPSPNAPELKLFLDRMTSAPDETSFMAESQDGEVGQWGQTCQHTPSLDPPPIVSGVATCESRATDRIRLYGSVAEACSPPKKPWDPLDPVLSSTFHVDAHALGEDSLTVPYRLHFRCEGDRAWSVHALLAGELLGVELGGGTFEFDESGYVTDSSSLWLKLPARAGSSSGHVALDLSLDLDESGNRRSGLYAQGNGSWGFQSGVEPSPLDCRSLAP